MIRNKLGHTILGTVVGVVGLLGLSGDWLSGRIDILFVAMIVIGAMWAWVIGHAWMVVPALVVGPIEWMCEQLDPRPAAKVKRKARRDGASAVSMRDIQYYGDDLGHRFRYAFDDEGTPVLTDMGLREDFKGHRVDYVFCVGHRTAYVYDFREDSPVWRRIEQRDWIEQDEQPDGREVRTQST